MPKNHATDPDLGRILSKFSYAIIRLGFFPDEAKLAWFSLTAAPSGEIISARMAGYLGVAGAALLRLAAKDSPKEIPKTVLGIISAAFLLKPGHVLDAIQDVVERLDTDVRDGLFPELACVPILIEKEIDRLIDARSSSLSSEDLVHNLYPDIPSRESRECRPSPSHTSPFGPPGLSNSKPWDALWERFQIVQKRYPHAASVSKVMSAHPAQDWPIENLIAVRLRWKWRRSMGLC